MNIPVATFASLALMAGTGLASSADGDLEFQAVQWTQESGGNGHWYVWVELAEGYSWSACRTAAENEPHAALRESPRDPGAEAPARTAHEGDASRGERPGAAHAAEASSARSRSRSDPAGSWKTRSPNSGTIARIRSKRSAWMSS